MNRINSRHGLRIISGFILILLFQNCDQAFKSNNGTSFDSSEGREQPLSQNQIISEPGATPELSPPPTTKSESSGSGTFAFKVISTSNRRHFDSAGNLLMAGAWGNHLRGPIRDGLGKLWLPFDVATDPYHNVANHLYSKSLNGEWAYANGLYTTPGIRQNLASIQFNDALFSYGISSEAPRGEYLSECYVSTVNPNIKGCNAVAINGTPLILPQSNYVGAAISPNGRTRVVWWASTWGGGIGSFQYIYNDGSAWIGPIRQNFSYSGINFNTFEYIRARVTADRKLVMAGTGYWGEMSWTSFFGQGFLAVAQLGGYATFTPLFNSDPSSGTNIKSYMSEDVFVSPLDGSIHVVTSSTTRGLGFHYVPSGGSPQDSQVAVSNLPGCQARFHFNEVTNVLSLISTSCGSEIFIRQVKIAANMGTIDWSGISPRSITDPGIAAIGPISAIYVESQQYQSKVTHEPTFAILGSVGKHDNVMYEGIFSGGLK